MASSTPLRRALVPRDVNQTLTPTTSINRVKGSHPNMSTKPFLPSEETSIPKNISTPEISRAIPREIEVGSGKRGHDLLEGTGEIHMGTKKFKGAGHGDSGGRMGEDFDGLEKDDESEQANIGHVYAEKLQDNPDASSRSPSPAISPTSSFASSHGGDNTQQTMFTEPDRSPGTRNVGVISNQPERRTPTKEEARERIQKMRLRLQLAAYKVQTNQIDVPMSRLEVRSTPSSPHNARPMQVPQPTTIARQALAATPLNTLSASQLSTEDSLTSPEHQPNGFVSPQKESTTSREGYNTPVLPRQRQSIINPPSLGSPRETDLTSSAVKGNAARDLLMLREVVG